MRDRIEEIKANVAHTKIHDRAIKIPCEDFEWLIEQAEKTKEYEESLKTIIKLTPCDDTRDFARRTLQGKQKTNLPYRFNQI